MDDQGLQWWQQLGAHEVDEFNAWLDGIESEKAIAQPVQYACFLGEKNVESDCK